ncbi:hypothetical protein ACZ91_16955 [Streptomyces regensis]|nr:hypothetical protein ACZ91_16955 [Streptomyces regensis]
MARYERDAASTEVQGLVHRVAHPQHLAVPADNTGKGRQCLADATPGEHALSAGALGHDILPHVWPLWTDEEFVGAVQCRRQIGQCAPVASCEFADPRRSGAPGEHSLCHVA